MNGFLAMLQMLFVCVTVFGLVFVIALALPKSRLRSYTLEVMKYLFAAVCLLLVISPIDILPDAIPLLGWGDDLGYIAAAIASYASAKKEHKERKSLN